MYTRPNALPLESVCESNPAPGAASIVEIRFYALFALCLRVPVERGVHGRRAQSKGCFKGRAEF